MSAPIIDGLRHYERLFGDRSARRKSLDRSSLPSPLAYLSEQGLLIGRPRGERAQIKCPSHAGGDERHASMSVSLVDGHFRCFACGAKGGDVVALHRLITGKGFRDAVADLG